MFLMHLSEVLTEGLQMEAHVPDDAFAIASTDYIRCSSLAMNEDTPYTVLSLICLARHHKSTHCCCVCGFSTAAGL
jgi:hypothetical protein